MAGKNTAVFGIFPGRVSAEEAVEALKTAGFRGTDISVLLAENQGTKDLAVQKGTKAPEGAAAGATSGAIIGGVLGGLAGVGALAIPGIGPLIAAGPIIAALTGVGALGVVGGIVGALAGMGVPEYEAKRHEGRIREGGVLLSVHCDDHEWVKRAKEILHHMGAEDIASAGEAKADFAVSDKPKPRMGTARTDPAAPDTVTERARVQGEADRLAADRAAAERAEAERADLDDTTEIPRTRTSGGGI